MEDAWKCSLIADKRNYKQLATVLLVSRELNSFVFKVVLHHIMHMDINLSYYATGNNNNNYKLL